MHSHLESPISSEMKRLNSEKCLGECAEKKKYPISAQDYELIEEIGQGVSASVHRALCIPFNEVVAIKILDFERNNSDLSNICREAQTMILVDHPNVLKAHCSFVNDHSLWVVMPYMAGGSCLHILKAAYPDGFEEVIIATVLREVLRGLEYLHHHGHIHRDVKAGNILVDLRGAIKLGDFGVSACLFDSGDRQRSRNTFVGTPCWMAPEVMEQLHGYDFKADIWSFGITALELAHGHAPFSKYPPMKVLLMTLQNAPPGLDYERDKKFSKSFKQMIAMCLVKDPSKRPSAQKLLKHTFFKQARSSDYIARKILEGLPTLGDRLKALKLKEADMLAQKKMPDGEKEEISQNEYKRGISGWNFNIEDVKTQASLIQDIDEADKDQGCCSNSFLRMDSMQERQSQWVPSNMTNSLREKEDDDVMKNKASPLPLSERSLNHTNGSEDEHSARGSTCEQDILQNGFLSHDNVNKIDLNESGGPGTYEKHLDCTTTRSFHESGVSMGPDATDNCVSPLKGESEKHQNQLQIIGNCSVPVVSLVVDDTSSENLPKCVIAASNGDESDEKGKVPVVQQKGRFKVTSESVGLEKSLPTPLLQKSHSMQVITQHPSISLLSSPGDAMMNQGSSLFSQLHYILQTNIIQRDNILNLMKQLSTGDISANNTSNGGCIQIPATITEKSLLEAAHDREKELIHDINDLQLRLLCAQEELQRLKTKNAQA